MGNKKPVPDALSQEEILNVIRDDRLKLRTKALISLLYMTGGRITEVLNIRPMDIERAGDKFVTITMITEKKRKVTTRKVPILMRPIESRMMEYVLTYIDAKNVRDDKKVFKMDRVRAWRILHQIEIVARATDPVTREVIENYKFGLYNHYLRHCRATHFKTVYNLAELDMMVVLGWSDTRPAKTYAHLGWRDVADKMEREIERGA